MRRNILLSITCLLMVTLTACHSQDSKSHKLNSDKLTLAWGEDFGDVNPHRYNPDQFVIQDMVYEGLVRYGDNGKIEPALAESWSISQDGKTYTFKLRNAKYSDGSNFNAANVKRNFDSIFSKSNRGNHNWFNLTNQLENYRALNQSTFEIKLKQAYSATLYDLSMIRPIRFLSDNAFPKGDDTTKKNVKKPIGTGQWVVKSKKQNEYITFKRNENYWGKKPKLKEVTVKVIPDAQTRALAFESGDVDLIYGNGIIGLDTFAQYTKDKKYVTAVSQPMSTRLLLLNAKESIFQDKKVRQAMNHAIDKVSIAKNTFRGTEKPADTIFSKSTPHSDAKLNTYSYNVDKANQLLDQAGWKLGKDKVREKDGKALTLRLPYIATKATDKDLVTYFQGEWRKIGINVSLIAMEEDDYWANAKKGNFDMMLTYSWGAPWDPHAWMSALTAKADHGHPENIALENLATKTEMDRLIKSALVDPKEENVDRDYKKVLELLHDEAVYIPLTYQSVISVYRKGDFKTMRFAPEENSFPLRYIEKIMYLSSSIIKKILSAFLALFFISLLTFILIKLSTVNPAENYLRLSKISVSPEALKEAEHYLGLDKPLWKQYWLWFQKALTGDFGYSYVLRLPVLDLVLQRFLATLFLGTSAFLLIVTISTPLGVWAGLHESARSDHLIRFLSFSSVSMPSFWVAYLLMLLFSAKLNLLPVSGGNDLQSLILPSITLSFSTVGQYIALIRKAISQENRSLNVENARLRGVKERYIVTHHLLRNALPAIMTALSLTWVYLLTGSIIVEEIFSWNGIGRLFVSSLRTSDLPVIQACMLIFGTLFLANNFMTQCLMNWVDPRLRKSREK